MSNAVLERSHQVLENLVQTFNISQTYVDENDPQTGILAAAAFAILSTTNRLKFYSTVQFLFGHEMILTIKHEVDWELTHQKKQAQISKYYIYENKHRVDHNYKVGDKVIITKHTAY